MIRASEKNGTHGLRPHASLSKGSYLGSLQVTNNVTSGDGVRSRIEIGLDSRATIWDLKKRIGEEVVKTSVDGGKTWGYHAKPGGGEPSKPVHPATIRLFQMATASDLRDATHGSTLSELKFKPNENLGAFKKSPHMFRKARVVEDSPATQRPELTHRAKQVAAEVFEEYSVLAPEG